jgi:hypothetical protein
MFHPSFANLVLTSSHHGHGRNPYSTLGDAQQTEAWDARPADECANDCYTKQDSFKNVCKPNITPLITELLTSDHVCVLVPSEEESSHRLRLVICPDYQIS